MLKNFLNFLIAIKRPITKIGDFIEKGKDKSEEVPKVGIGSLTFLLLISLIALLILVYWVEEWLPNVTPESARWALSAQVQATAAILGLLIVAMAFRWRMVTNQEQQLRSSIYSYLKTMGTATSGTIPPSPLVINLAYEKYLAWITAAREKKQKMDKAVFINLGRLWVIKELSFIHSSGGAKELSRRLKHGQIKQLSKISKLSNQSALEMWESYFRNSAQFILDMYEALGHIYTTLFSLERKDSGKDKIKQSGGNTFDVIISVVSRILADGNKLMAEEIKRVRLTSKKPFYFVGGLLIVAIVVGLLALTGISDINSLLNTNSNAIRWVVGVPVGLSVYGVLLCFDFIRSIWS